MSDHDNKQHTGDMEDDLTDGLGGNLSDIMSHNPSEPEPRRQSEIASMQKMMEEQ